MLPSWCRALLSALARESIREILRALRDLCSQGAGRLHTVEPFITASPYWCTTTRIRVMVNRNEGLSSISTPSTLLYSHWQSSFFSLLFPCRKIWCILQHIPHWSAPFPCCVGSVPLTAVAVRSDDEHMLPQEKQARRISACATITAHVSLSVSGDAPAYYVSIIYGLTRRLLRKTLISINL